MNAFPSQREEGWQVEVRYTLLRTRTNADLPQCSLVIWEWIPAHAILKNRGGVRVLRHRAKVEHPVILPVVCIQKPLRIFAFISVKAFHTGRWVTHNDHSICDVGEILNEIRTNVGGSVLFWRRRGFDERLT